MKIYSNAGYKGEVIKNYFFNYSVYSNNFSTNTKTGISNFEEKLQTSGGLIYDEKCELESGPFEELAKNNQIMDI